MTALTGPFIVNSGGSDSTASGVGPSTAVSFSAMIDSSSSPTQVTASSGVSGLSAGDVLFANTSNGRKFNVIASISSQFGTTTITCDYSWADNFMGTVYCGGKRATLGGLADVFDTTNGFDCEVSLETDVTMNATATCGSSREVKIYSDTSKTRRKITTNQQYPFSGGNWTFTDLTFHSSYSSSDGRLFRSEFSTGYASVIAENCIFGDVNNTNNFNQLVNAVSSVTALNTPMPFYARGCLFVNFNRAVGAAYRPHFIDCHFADMPYINQGMYGGVNADLLVEGMFSNCFFENVSRIDSATDGRYLAFSGCIFDGLAGTNPDPVGAASFNFDNGKECPLFSNNLLTNCGFISDEVQGRGNILYNTTTGMAAFTQSETLASDPYTNRSGGDFTLTSSMQNRFKFELPDITAKSYSSLHSDSGSGSVIVIED